MNRNRTLLQLLVVCAVMAVALASNAWATPASDWLTSSEISKAMSLPDGSHVSLRLEEIVKIKNDPAYIVIAEPFHRKDRLICLTYPSPELRLGQVVDIEGDLTTLANGARALQNVTVWGYASESGELTYHPSIIKHLSDETPWRWGKIDLTDRSAASSSSSAASVSSDEPNSDPAVGPTYYSRIGNAFESANPQTQGVRTQSFYDGIPDLEGLAAGSLVELQCKRIIGVGTETINGTPYNYLDIAEDLPATDWIRCYYSAGTATTSQRVNKVTGQIQYTNGGATEVICIDNGPDYNPQILEGKLNLVDPNTVPFVRTQANGASASLTGKIVTANQTDFPGALYVQETSSSGYFGGIRVRYSGSTIARGSLVDVTGSVTLAADGEREVNAGSTGVSFIEQSTVPGPLGMPNKHLGGGDFNVYTPGVSNPDGSGVGLHNKGLLVKIWGKVTAVDAGNKFFYIDDGTGFQDGSGNTGVKVNWAWSPTGKPSILPPAVDWYVSVIGLSSSDTADSGATFYRVLRPREQSDILVFNPQDPADPVVAITTPSDGEIHKAPSQATVRLAGTATDADTGVTSVYVGFTATGSQTPPTTWYLANYDETTFVWTYDWQNSQTQRVWVKAVDFAARTATINRDVTVSTLTGVKYVRPGGAGSKNGSSWDNAEDKVGDAITAATDGTEVWVAQGVYQERITLKSGVAVYGGFTPTDTYREQRNWSANQTVLDGNQAGSVVTVPSGATSGTTIDGFTIRNGSASYGAGIYSYYSNASATIANNIIRANNSSYSGGGLYANGSTLTIVGNVFVGNSASSGGGIYYSNSSGQVVKLANNTIIGNAASDGGGIYLYYSSADLSLSNNIIAFNTGGGIYKYSGSPVFTKNDIYGNNANGKYEYSWTTTYPVGTDLVPVDPVIPNVVSGDWHIAGTSPCHDPSGTTLAVTMEKDIDAGNRVYGSTVDIGADEWNGTDPEPVTPSIIYVKPSSQGGSDSNNGTSWTLAVATVQKGADLAYAAGGGEVWVAAGAYGKATLKSFVKLYGGFTVGDTSKSARDWETNQTILDAASSGRAVSISNATGCVVDGFVIRNGGANNGSGIYCSNASATIANNIIRANNGSGYSGGGLYGSGSTLTVAGNVFVDNKASSGAGIYYTNVSGQMANNTIIKNVSTGDGGGVYLYSGSPALSNNIIAFNTGGGIYKYSGSPTFTKNDVYGNNSNGKYEYSWTTTYPVGTDLVPADPVIPNIGWGDWHIGETSPCHDPSGTTLAVTMDKDIDVGNRVYGSTVDIGADEWNGTDPTPTNPTVIYVKPSSQGGSDSNNGTSWTLAVATVQKGADLAYTAGGGEVWVAAGAYGKADLKSFVKVYGGFAVGDSSKSVRDWKTNQTILDGQTSGSVVKINSAVECVVDGFIVRNGGATTGSGINCSNAVATVANNIVRANSAGTNYGGGLYASGSTLAVAGNVFVGNSAGYGGGIYFTNAGGQIANNTVISNAASSDCGGIYLTSSSPTLSNNIVASNAGGGVYKSGGSPTFTKNNVFGNGKYEYSWTTTYPVGTDLVPVDPVIPNIAWGDWHIAGTSPCHDPSGTTQAVAMDKDIDAGNRIYGSTLDIGADEWNGTDPTLANPTVIYVKPSSQGGSDSNNGTSWTLAVATVQKGIDLAYSAGNSEVWVAAGAYGKATLKPFVKVYGGFAVGDTSKSARDWKTNQTVLDAVANGSVVTISNAVGCVVDGFVIRNGGSTNGSGVNCSSASAMITNNIIRNNAGGSYGGGLYASVSTLTVAGNVFVGNAATTGGGIYFTNTNGQIANNTVLGNVASSDCGGIYLTSSSPALSNNIVASNVGGGIYKSGGLPTFTKNDVYGNNANAKYEYSWTTTYPVDTDLVPVDPVIPNIAWGDWHIASTSPCHDPSGTTLAVTMDKDIDAGNRVYGSTVDIGADEWNGTDPTPTNPTIIYVKPSSQGGSDSNNGTSWTLAVATVQKGIDLAYSAGNSEVWVAAGSYAKASLEPFVKVYGGFAVGDTSKSARDWKTNQTILDGEANGPVITISSAVGCAVDGFTIRNGRGYYSGYSYYGGGIYCSNATATIANNIIRASKTSITYGGGLAASGSTLTVAGNVFIDNTASYGGGVYYSSSSGQIANNTIIWNTASSDGGGVYLTSSSPALSNNIVYSNAGGGIYKSGGTPTFTKNDVYGNNANGKYEYSWTTTYPVGTDLVPADPVIPNIGWGDWHIGETSPCHDPSGTTLAVTMDKDIDVGNRVYGSTVDIGADEWNGTDPSSATIIYVKPSSQGGSDSNNGTSWTLAVATVQKGIDLANDAGGAEVWVAAGAYAKANLKSFVKVYGGFAVGDSSKSVRDWKTNQTSLDGGGSGSVVMLTNTVGCVVDGFIIRNGTTSGGGINCSNAVATIANNVVRANNASSNNGGGLYASGSTLTIASNVFLDNKAYNGAGIYYTNTGGNIANNTIILNAASYNGGGIYLNSGSPTLSNNVVYSNTGGGIYKSSGSPTFTKNDVYGNNANGKYEYSWTTTYPVGTDLVPVDPVIPNIGWGDWHIAGTSPCHDPSGTTLAVTMDKDIDAGNRVYGSTVDIGADEWNGTDPIPGPPVEYPTIRLLDSSDYPVSTHYSCPLVADLIPGDNGANEVAVIAHKRFNGSSWVSDGRVYVWRADGTLVWTSKNLSNQDLFVDTYGDNTLSAADIDAMGDESNSHLELIAPGRGTNKVYAFAYDSVSSTFKCVAGWPTTTRQYAFIGVSAAIGDANLDGTKEVVAADNCCYVYSWNPSGEWNPSGSSYLWEHLTGSSLTSIDYSSVALGDINSFADSNRMPDAVVGSYYSSNELYAFMGDSWGTQPSDKYPAQWSPRNTDAVIESSPAIGLVDGDSENDVVVGDNNGKLYMWLSSTQTWTSCTLGSPSPIHSSPVIVELGGQRCVVAGCDNGRIYAVKSDGTPITGWPSDGISPSWRAGYKITASPAIADVLNTGSPQVVVACSDGNVYALWPDGNNHAGGPVAKMWVCAQSSGVEADSTPTICSLDGTQISMIVGSTDGIYKIDLYSLQQGETFVPSSTRWPWPTFHRDNARTGCTTASASPVSASIMGRVTLGGNPLPLAKISVKTLGGQNVSVYGRPSATRMDPVRSVGDATANNEANEGGYCISQLPPNTTYRITASDANGDHQTTFDVSVTTGMVVQNIALP